MRGISHRLDIVTVWMHSFLDVERLERRLAFNSGLNYTVPRGVCRVLSLSTDVFTVQSLDDKMGWGARPDAIIALTIIHSAFGLFQAAVTVPLEYRCYSETRVATST